MVRNFRTLVSLRSCCQVTYSRVAGGDEPPSVLSDNLERPGPMARPFHVPETLQKPSRHRSEEKRTIYSDPRPCTGNQVALTLIPRSFPIRYQTRSRTPHEGERK